MHKFTFLLTVLILLGSIDALAQPATAKPFDGNWLTKMTCEPKGTG